MVRVGKNQTYIRIYGVNTLFLAGTLSYIWSYTLHNIRFWPNLHMVSACLLKGTWLLLPTQRHIIFACLLKAHGLCLPTQRHMPTQGMCKAQQVLYGGSQLRPSPFFAPQLLSKSMCYVFCCVASTLGTHYVYYFLYGKHPGNSSCSLNTLGTHVYFSCTASTWEQFRSFYRTYS